MFKVVLACILTIACSSICDAKQSKKQIAQAIGGTSSPAAPQAADEPSLRGALPVSGTPSVVSPSASTTSTTTTLDSHPIPPQPTTQVQTTTDSTNVGGPVTDAFGNPLSPEQTGQTPPLPATASISDIAVTARVLDSSPLPRNHDEGLKYFQITVKNTGQNIAVILGNSSHADVNSTSLPTALASDSEESDIPRLNGKGKIAVGLVSAFSFGYCGPIFYEVLTPEQHRKRYLGTAIGRDGARHDVEDNHFGIRVIMPGDESVGWMAFRCPQDEAVKSLSIPISFTRSAVPAGTISVPVASAATK